MRMKKQELMDERTDFINEFNNNQSHRSVQNGTQKSSEKSHSIGRLLFAAGTVGHMCKAAEVLTTDSYTPKKHIFFQKEGVSRNTELAHT